MEHATDQVFETKDGHYCVVRGETYGPWPTREQAEIGLQRAARVEECRVVLGHNFRPMTDDDWECFAGAEPETLICWIDDGALLLEPSGDVVESRADGETRWSCRAWR